MTTLKDLQDAEVAARARYRLAEDVWRSARRAVEHFRMNEAGLAGHVVEFDEPFGYGRPPKMRTYRLRVDGLSPGGSLQGCVVKTDGTIGIVRKSVRPEKARDLGPYVAPDGGGQ